MDRKTKDRDARWASMMQEALSGNQKAYEELLFEISKVMRSFLSKRVNDASAVEDLIQEVLLGIHKARHTYRPGKSFGSWAFAIARYKHIDYLRSQGRRNQREVAEAEIERHESLEDSAEGNSEISEALEEALKGLSPKQKKVVESLKVEGLTIKETAHQLKMSESAVKVTAHRAYKALKKILEDPN